MRTATTLLLLPRQVATCGGTTFSFFMAFLKLGGLVLLAGGGLWAAGFSFESVSLSPVGTSLGGFLGDIALALLGYKRFTTITNSGNEIKQPHKNVGRAIIISIGICVVTYLLVTLAVSSNLGIQEIVQARDYSPSQASRPAFGQTGLWLTVGFAIVATVSGVIASVFAVSHMLAMLTDMKLVPYRSLGAPGDSQTHTLVYSIAIAMLLTVFFDLSRIASLGAIFYIIMDIAVHWGVLRHTRKDVQANALMLVTTIVLDVVILGAFLVVNAQTDAMILIIAAVGLVVIFAGKRWFIRSHKDVSALR